MQLERRAWLAPVLAVPALLSLPALFGRVFLYRDILGLIIPQQVFRTRALAEGRLAQWNPLSYGGTPFLADPGVGTFYPPNYLFSIVPRPAMAATLFVLLHFAIAGLGMYLFLRRRMQHEPALAAVGAVAFQTSGYLLSMHGMHYACASVALLPLVLFLLEERWPAGAVAFALLVFAGELQTAFFAFVLALLLSERRLRTLFALGLGGALAAVQLVPTALFSRTTVRAHGMRFVEATNWSLHPLRILEFLVPSPFGVGYVANHFFGTALLEHGRTSPWAAGLALGGCFVLCAALADYRARSARMWAAIGAGSLVLALGHHTPLFALWLRAVPFFRYPEKYAAVTTLALVVLATQGLRDRLRARWLWIAPALLLAAAVAVTLQPAPLVAFAADGLRRAVANVEAPVALAECAGTLFSTALFAAVLALALELLRRRPQAVWLVLAIVAIGGLTQASRLLSWGDGSFLETRPPLVQALLDARDPKLADRVFREYCPFAGVPSDGTLLERVRKWEWQSGKPNFPSLFGVPDAVGYGPAESAEKWRVFRSLDDVAGPRLFGASHRIHCTPEGEIRLQPIPDPLPRVSPGADIVEDRPELVRIHSHGAGGPLRLLDSYEPGWTATLDGAPVAISRADDLWRSVPVPAGDHEIVFRYRTPGLIAGALVSLLALAVIIWRWAR